MTDTSINVPLKFWFAEPKIVYTKEGQERIDKIKTHGQKYLSDVILFFTSYKLNDEIPDSMIEPLTYCLPDPHIQMIANPMIFLNFDYYGDAYLALTSFFPFNRTSSDKFYLTFLEQKYNLECKNSQIMLKARYHIDELPGNIDLSSLINVNNVCGCVQDSVVPCVNNWIINGNPPIKHEGITNIFVYVANKGDYETLNEFGKDVITTILLAMDLRQKNADSKITYVPNFIMQYYKLNYDQASVVLYALDKFVDHGCALRCPWLSHTSKEFLHKQNQDHIVQLYNKLIQWIDR